MNPILKDDKLGGMWTFLLERGRVALLLSVIALMWGAFAYETMPRESSPDVEVPAALITTVWPGASATDVEKLITEKIEREIKSLEDVKVYSSSSQASLSAINVEFESGTDMDENMQALREALDDAERELPNSLPDDPDLEELSVNDLPILSLNLSGDFGLTELKRFAETLQDEFEGVSGVKEVNVSGLPEEQVHLYLDPIKLRGYGLSVESVAQKIQAAHIDLPLGKVFLDGGKVQLRIEGELEQVTDFLELPIARQQGQVVKLSEIAEVRREFDELEVHTYFSAGNAFQRSLTLDLIKSDAKVNVARAVEQAFEIVETYKTNGSLPPNLEISTVADYSVDIQEDLDRLIATGSQTLILIVIILYFALGWRESLLALISIPISMFIAIGTLQVMGQTFNFLSLFSLILAIGLLVDNAIIMVEGVSDGIFEKKLKPIAAAKNAIAVFRWPIITGTFTTIFAFLPMAFMISGVSGDFIKVIPYTVMVVLIASLFVSLFLMPVMGAAFFTFFPPKGHQENPYMARLKRWYIPKMHKFLRKPKKVMATLGLATLVLVFSVALVPLGLVPVEIFPGSDENFYAARIEVPKGTKLEETAQLLPAIESAVLPLFGQDSELHGGLKHIEITIGRHSNYDPERLNGRVTGPEPEIIGITFNLYEKRKLGSGESARITAEKLKAVVPDYATITMGELETGPPTGANPIEVRLVSEDLEHLEEITEDLKAAFAEIQLGSGATLKDITDNRGEILPQITWKIDRDRMENFGLSLGQVNQTLRSAIEGVTVIRLSEGEDEIDVNLRLDFAGDTVWTDPDSLDIINAIPLQLPSGDYITLADVAELEIGPQRSVIRHRDGKRTVTVGANVEGRATPTQFTKDIQKAVDALERWPGDQFQIGGDNEESNRLMGEMGNAMGFAVILIAIILVLQFNSFVQPFVIIAAIPLSLTGVFIGFWLTQTPISFPTMIGIVALAGIIVNDDIVLIDHINHHYKKRKRNLALTQGVDDKAQDDEDYVHALVEGCVSRMQPIFLTSITTVIGMLPLAMSDPVWRGLGFAVIYGMSLSTILTLLLTPCIMLFFRYAQDWIEKRWAKLIE